MYLLSTQHVPSFELGALEGRLLHFGLKWPVECTLLPLLHCLWSPNKSWAKNKKAQKHMDKHKRRREHSQQEMSAKLWNLENWWATYHWQITESRKKALVQRQRSEASPFVPQGLGIGGPRPLKGKTAEGLKTGELVESLQDFYPQTLSLIPVRNWTFNQGNLWTWELSGQGSKLKTEGVNKTTVHSEAAQHLCPREMVGKIPLQRNEPKLKNYRYWQLEHP